MKKRYIIILVTFLVGAFSCSKDWLDVNTNPNNATTATAELVFPSGVASVAAQVGGYYNLLGGFWSQYWSQSNSANQYKYIDQYEIPASAFNAIWREMYVGAISDLQITINEARKVENWSYNMMATVMQVYAWQIMVDLYDNVPYYQALSADSASRNFNPVYDNGQDIYDNLILRLDEAIAKGTSPLSAKQQKQDLVFYKDGISVSAQMEDWIRFANTLKLKIYLRQAYARPTVAQAGVSALYASGALFLNKDAALKVYKDEEGKDNPLYASNVRKLNVGTNLRVSATLYRYLEAKKDPRLNTYLSDVTKKNPMPQGGFNIPTIEMDPSSVCVFKQTPIDPVYFISLVESNLLQAEAIVRGWGTGNAKTLYDAAITQDFTRKGIATGPLDSLLVKSIYYAYPSAGTSEVQLEAIIMAKWVAFAGSQSLEAFFETNRTGYPKVSTIPAWVDGNYNENYIPGLLTYSLEGTTSGLFPKRLLYPQDEVNTNSSFPGQTEVTQKVWWDKK
jgi:hypothetical protein